MHTEKLNKVANENFRMSKKKLRGSLTNRLLKMEGRITGVEDKVKEQMDSPKIIQAQNMQET